MRRGRLNDTRLATPIRSQVLYKVISYWAVVYFLNCAFNQVCVGTVWQNWRLLVYVREEQTFLRGVWLQGWFSLIDVPLFHIWFNVGAYLLLSNLDIHLSHTLLVFGSRQFPLRRLFESVLGWKIRKSLPPNFVTFILKHLQVTDCRWILRGQREESTFKWRGALFI